jgi:hypothetical protein
MEYNDFAVSEYKRFMGDSIEEKIKQRIDECKKLDIHNTLRILLSTYSADKIKELGISEFGIERIDIETTSAGNDSITIIKSEGVVYYFVRKTEKVEKFSTFNGIDEITICLSVNSKIVFKSKWQHSYSMGRWDYDSTDYPEEILAYIPGDWYNDLSSISRKKRNMEEEACKIEAEKDKIKKFKYDISNFGL